MIDEEQNERLTRVGPGTPMGDLLRRYWHPVAAASELDERPVLATKILGESLVLYRDRSGTVGLLDDRCPHRGASLACGIPESEGLRCAYHGWRFDGEGRCVEQPAEPPQSRFKDRIRTSAYPVEELGGLLFAYLGPEPAPLLPKYDLFVWEDAVRYAGVAELPCNWLQIMENSFDPVHGEYLHGHFMRYVLERQGANADGALLQHHVDMAFDVFEHGVIKRRLLEGQTKDAEDWRIGHPVVFPNMVRVGTGRNPSFEIRVPRDDTHTRHYWYTAYRTPDRVPDQSSVPVYAVPFKDDRGDFIGDFVAGQDMMAWLSQGEIADRTRENLCTSDRGILLYRRLLVEQCEKVQRGEDPLAVLRDPSENVLIELPQEQTLYGGGASQAMTFERNHARYNPHHEEVRRLMGV